MIPPVVMYVLAALLGAWGVYRLWVGRRRDARGRGAHLIFGTLYLLMGVYLILTTARVIPPPRLFGSPPTTAPAGPVEVVPLTRIPLRPPPATLPTAAPATAPSR